jgi:hypothetical protein
MHQERRKHKAKPSPARGCPGSVLAGVLLLLLLILPVRAQANDRTHISGKEMLVRLHPDGSADVTERIVFDIHGSVNNLVMEIRKPEMGDVKLEKVISGGYRGDVTCRPLESGQWDPTVFAGTYSLIEEPDRLLIKAYYTFGKHRSQFVLQYHLSQAAVRYGDMSVFTLAPVGAAWPTAVDQLQIRVVLPQAVEPGQVEALLRGVFAGTTSLVENQTLQVTIPNVVPGEAPVLEVVLPSDMLSQAPLSQNQTTRAQWMEQRRHLREVGLLTALEARERMAEQAGWDALADLLWQRTRLFSGYAALAATLAGLLLLLVIQRRIRTPKALPPTGEKLSLLRQQPWLVPMLASGGRFGAPALEAILWQAVADNRLEVGQKQVKGRSEIVFRRTPMPEPSSSVLQQKLLQWLSCVEDGTGAFCPACPDGDPGRTERMLSAWHDLSGEARMQFGRYGFLTRIHERLRRRALLVGLLLFSCGLASGVALMIWQGYVMLVPAVLLVLRGVTGTGFNSRAVGLRRWLGKHKDNPLRQPAGSPFSAHTGGTRENHRLKTSLHRLLPLFK